MAGFATPVCPNCNHFPHVGAECKEGLCDCVVSDDGRFGTRSNPPWGPPRGWPVSPKMKIGPEGVEVGAEQVDHPAHYGGEDNVYEVIKVLEAWGLTSDAYLFNVVKYIARAGKKGAAKVDLEKAAWYLNRRIETLDG